MKKILIPALVSMLGVSPLVHAQAYKCKQANGSTAFQDHPCASGSTGSMVDLPPVQSYAPGDVGHADETSDASQGRRGRRVSGDIDAANARIEAENRQTRCNSARQRLGVLKEERPVYRRDNAGNRIYVEDKERPAAIAEAQREVAANCQ